MGSILIFDIAVVEVMGRDGSDSHRVGAVLVAGSVSRFLLAGAALQMKVQTYYG